ncbi:MAG: nonribosomal peptide synthetase MxaA [Hyphomicrobium sp.]|jgi:mxaA protein
MRRALSLGMVLGLLVGGAALARASTVRVVEPRAFGYFLGDTLQREIEVRLARGEQLDLASLPRPGPINYWLELSSANVTTHSEGDDSVYRIVLIYQTFYAPLDPRKLTIPGFTLLAKGAPGTGEVRVRDFGFLTSPIRQLFAASSQSSGSSVTLQPDALPPRLTTGAERTALLFAGSAWVAALGGLAWHNAWWPFRRRPARPFTEAARFINSNTQKLADADGYRVALLRMHRAFDLAAGRRVLADDVNNFVVKHPEFAAYRSGVERMFASSRQAFFANDVERAIGDMPLPALAELSAQLGAAERRAA